MKASHQIAFCLLVLLAAGFSATRLSSGQKDSPAQKQKSATGQSTPAAQQSQVDRGRYLVENVGMCGECHTPRDSYGNTDNSRLLQGAPIWIVPVRPNTNWAMRAPPLAGLPEFTDAQVEIILEKGVGPNGLAIQPPMHIYHMNHADSTAIIAYLRSLPAAFPRE